MNLLIFTTINIIVCFHKQKCLITAQSWDAHQILAIKTLVYTGKQPLTLVMMGGGAQSAPPLFLFVKTIEKVMRLCTVFKKNSLIDSFKDKAIFHVILEIDR